MWRQAALTLVLALVTGCTDFLNRENARVPHPSVAPATQPVTALKIEQSQIRPMYERRMLATDLPTTVRVAMTHSIDIQAAQERIAAARGEYEASIGLIFPSLTPNVTALGLEGAVATPAGLAVQGFNHVFPIAALQWIINPGQVAYNVIASKRRLEASDQRDLAVIQETTRVAAVQYYDVVLAQAQVGIARRALQEAEELLRLERLRAKTGTGLPVDELRAEAALALRRQNVLTALNAFYNASVALTGTLYLDPTVMLVPRAGSVRQKALVREDLSIDQMLFTATYYRPDLEAVRALAAAADADTGATTWGGLGPQVLASRTFTTRPPAQAIADTEYRQQVYTATGGFNWSLASFGRIKTAAANAKIAGLDVERQLDLVQAAVVTAHQTSLTAKQTIPIAQQEVKSAEEALRLTRKNLETGTGLTIDVLVAQDAADQARLRYATAIVRYNQAEINLLAALGLIDQASVAARNP